jgi:NADH:ubiquinone oxidoreductase subunit E
LEIVKSFIKDHHLEGRVFFHGELCTGHCDKGPVFKIDNQLFEHVTHDNIYDILLEYFELKSLHN